MLGYAGLTLLRAIPYGVTCTDLKMPRRVRQLLLGPFCCLCVEQPVPMLEF